MSPGVANHSFFYSEFSCVCLECKKQKTVYFYARALIQCAAVASRAILANLRRSSCPRALSTLRGQFWAKKKSSDRSPICGFAFLKPFCAQSESALYNLKWSESNGLDRLLHLCLKILQLTQVTANGWANHCLFFSITKPNFEFLSVQISSWRTLENKS